MSSKSKGSNAERELIHLFWQTGTWAACRVAGSGSSQYPSADIIASNSKRRIIIEAKVTKEQSKYFDNEEIAQIREFISKFGAEAWIAVKFKGCCWYFLPLDSLEKAKNSFMISSEMAKTKGLTFEELVRDKELS